MAKLHGMYGLSIAEGNEPTANRSIDICWQHRPVDNLPNYGRMLIGHIDQTDGVWTRHVFAAGGTVYCVFEVSPTGRLVQSQAIPAMQSDNLRELFSETVMRTVLTRLGHPAFHAAALEKNGLAVLLMGRKGAGKSTFAAALQRAGWSLLADDLVRVLKKDGTWCALAGMRRNKLRPDSMRALGHPVEKAQLRWMGDLPAGSEHLIEEKLLVQPGTAGFEESPTPIQAVLSLGTRSQSAATAQTIELPARAAVVRLSAHLIRDPLPPHAPPPASGSMLSELIHQAAICDFHLPDDLACVSAIAAELEAMLRPAAVS